MKNRNRVVVNIFLRGVTLGTKFLLVFFLAKYLDPSLLGYYGLFSAAIIYSMFFVGLDFYVYTSRELPKHPDQEKGYILKCQAVLSLFLYVVFTPIIYFIISGFLDGDFLIWFFPILIVEHINQEIYRLLIALSNQVLASVLLFFRHATWAIIIVVLMSLEHEYRDLESIFFFWFWSGLLTVLSGVLIISKFGMGGWGKKIDLKLILRGVRVSGLFLFSTLALVGIKTSDRFFLESFTSVEVVGVYVLYIGIAGTLFTLMDAGVYSFTYPKLISLNHAGDNGAFNAVLHKVAMVSIIFSSVYVAIVYMLLPTILHWIDNPIYEEYKSMFNWLLLSAVVHVLSMVPHYGLYAKGKDKQIIYSHLFGAFTFVTTSFFLSSYIPLLSVPVAMLVAFLVIFFWKGFSYYCLVKNNIIN